MVCDSCRREDHRTRASRRCPNHIPNRRERTGALFPNPIPNQMVSEQGVPLRKEFCIKDHLAGSLGLIELEPNGEPNSNLFHNINVYVERLRDITFRACLLDNYHTLSVLQEMREDLNDIFPNLRNQDYYRAIFRGICRTNLDPDIVGLADFICIHYKRFDIHILGFSIVGLCSKGKSAMFS